MTTTETKNDLFQSSLRNWEPVMTKLSFTNPLTGEETESQVNAILRNDSGVEIGNGKDSYHFISNAEKLEIMDRLVEDGVLDPRVRTGEFDNGGKVWLQGNPIAGGTVEIDGSPVVHKVTLTDSYDGSMSLGVLDSATAIVCRNTLALAHKQGRGHKLRHTRSIVERFKAVKDAILMSSATFKKNAEMFEAMAATPMRQQKFTELLDKLWPVPKGITTDEAQKRVERIMAKREDVQRFYEIAPGAKPGTLWGGYQAVTYYNTHNRGYAKAREKSNLMGEAIQESGRALQFLGAELANGQSEFEMLLGR